MNIAGMKGEVRGVDWDRVVVSVYVHPSAPSFLAGVFLMIFWTLYAFGLRGCRCVRFLVSLLHLLEWHFLQEWRW